MPKYMMEFRYNSEGYRGLVKSKASSRDAILRRHFLSVGGKLEAIYWTPTGKHTGIAIGYSSHGGGAGLLAAALASGVFDYIRATELLTSAEMDEALETIPAYTPPGSEAVG